MVQKKSNITIILFALLFGVAMSTDISDLINSKLLNYSNPTDSETDVNNKNSLEISAIESISVNASNIESKSSAKFSNISQEEVSKPTYPKPTIKLLVFKKHVDKQFSKTPVSLTYA